MIIGPPPKFHGTWDILLAAAAKDQFSPQVAELERAIASLKGTIAGLSSQDSPSANLGKITAAVSAVEQAANPSSTAFERVVLRCRRLNYPRRPDREDSSPVRHPLVAVERGD